MSAHPKRPSPRTGLLSRPRLAALLLGLALTGAVDAQTDPLAEGRGAFLAAYTAAEAGYNGIDSPALPGHPLYPWLRALRLRNALATGGAEAEPGVAAFLSEFGTAPVTRDLRRRWLERLAERQDWTAFLAYWRDDIGDERLRCRAIDAWLATGPDAELAGALAERWVKEAELPADCANGLAWLRTQPVYTAALVERRIRARLIEADLKRASPLLAELPPSRRAVLSAWVQLLQTPAESFAGLAEGVPTTADDEAVREAFLRYARKSPAEASALLPRLLAGLRPSAATAQALGVAAALPLAWSRDPAALGLFKQAGGEAPALDERALEWRLRSALWAGDWPQVLDWSSTLPNSLAQQPRWRYWRARALEALDRRAEAVPVYTRLAGEFDSYGLLAAWRLGQAYTPASRRVAVLTPEARAALAGIPAYLRASEAWQLQLRGIASLEWRETYEQLPAQLRPALVTIAGDWGWHDQAVVTATRQSLYDDVPALFPRPFRSEVEAAALLSGTPTEWIYGVMRKESVFKADAVSSADAIGLLQLLPSTAKLVAKRFQRPNPGREQLFDPAVNVPLGALHLRELADKYEGRWILALAAYNAGSRAADRWRPVDGRSREADVWIENIPYNETRGYIQRILLHVAAYRWLETGKPVRANNWLPPVPPATAS